LAAVGLLAAGSLTSHGSPPAPAGPDREATAIA
jgi:hypothetical protein